MTMTRAVLLYPIAAIVALLLPTFFYFRHARRPRISVAAAGIAGIHAVVVVAVVLLSTFARNEFGDSVWAKFSLFALDFPISLIALPAAYALDGGGDLAYVLMGLFFFGVLGSVQYLVIGAGMGWLMERLISQRRPAPYSPAPIQWLAIWSFFFALISFPLEGLLGIPAVVCGHMALVRMRTTHARGRAFAIVGVVLGYMTTGWLILSILLALFMS